MNINRRHFLGAIAAGGAGMVSMRAFALPPNQAFAPPPIVPQPEAPAPETPLCGDAPALLPQVLAALERHGPRIAARDVAGIVNFDAHSRLPRFQLVDLASGKVLKAMLVAHGRGSDPTNSGFAQRFSNRPGSYASSLGSFVTGDRYVGKHGPSRRLIGLEAENSAALERDIVIHAAAYVDARLASSQGRIGRSQGCFAVPRAEIATVLEVLGPGRLLLAWKDGAA